MSNDNTGGPFPAPSSSDELLPMDGDDELTVAEKKAKRAQRKATALHADVRVVAAYLTPPVLKNV